MHTGLNPVSKTVKTPYQAARDALIPLAEAHANSITSRKDHGVQWSLLFFAEMDRLAREKGLVTYDAEAARAEAERREREEQANE